MAARNPLRAQTRVRSADTRSAQTQTHTLTAAPVRSVRSAEDVRSALIAELELHLSTTTNKQGRPFQRRTINAYKYAATQLHHWLTQSPQINAVGVAVTSFTDVDTATLNRYFRWYYETHDIPKSQDGKGGYTGGTNTTQRNLRAMFAYLAEEYEHPDPYGDPKLQRYATPPMGKPKTLSEEFVSDCLKITEWGPRPGNKEFHAVRDHALLRVLTEGLRSDEVLNLRTIDLDLRGGTLVVVPLKMDRNSTDGRTIPLQPKTVKALTRYLRVRALHRRADDEWLWLGTRNRSRLLYAGLHRMTKRRAEEAGYDPASVSPHSFCHTWADDLKAAGVSGEHIMAIRGWKSPAMLRRYGADMASRRAVDAVQSLGDRY